jgi:hypothetical protein
MVVPLVVCDDVEDKGHNDLRLGRRCDDGKEALTVVYLTALALIGINSETKKVIRSMVQGEKEEKKCGSYQGRTCDSWCILS